MRSTFIEAFALAIASLAVICWWRGIWNLLDKYVFPKKFLLSQVASIGIGIVVYALFVWIFPELVPGT